MFEMQHEGKRGGAEKCQKVSQITRMAPIGRTNYFLNSIVYERGLKLKTVLGRIEKENVFAGRRSK